MAESLSVKCYVIPFAVKGGVRRCMYHCESNNLLEDASEHPGASVTACLAEWDPWIGDTNA